MNNFSHSSLILPLRRLYRSAFTLLLILLLVTAWSGSVSAQTNPPDAQARAVQQYPALGIQGSPLNAKFVSEYKRLRASNPAFFNDSDWALKLARQCAESLPAGTASSTSPAPQSPQSSVSTQSATIHSAEWPGYRGLNGDGITNEKLNLNWSANAPKVLWKVPLNTGFSSFAIGGGKAFTQVARDINDAPREICVALDATTGKELWAADLAVGKGYSGGGPGDGPRSTPAVSGSIVCVLTPDLVLHALNAQSGAVLWTHDLIKEFAARNIQWNSAASPVIDGDLVFVMGGGAGQSLLAFNKNTGQLAWKTGTESITHATPVVSTLQGERQVLFFCQSGLVSVSVKDGRSLWKFPYGYKVSTAASPVIGGELVFCSAGYDVGGGACKIAKQGSDLTATPVWQVPGNTEVANHWSTPVYKDGYLYGMFSFKNPGKGPLKCVEIATGKVKWVQPGFGQGNIILVGDKLLALSDAGDLVVVEPTPEAYKELGRTKAVAGKCWSTPAVSNGCIFVRSTQEGVCLQVSASNLNAPAGGQNVAGTPATPSGNTNAAASINASATTDGANPWKHWPNSDIQPDAGNIMGIAVERTSGDLLVLKTAGREKVIWKSSDQAKSFTKGKSDGITGFYLYGRSYAFSFDPAGKRIALFPIMGNGGISTDGGLNWTPFVALPEAPKGLTQDCGVVDWEDTGKTCFALWHESGGKLMLSNDSGATWKIIGEKFLSPLGIFDEKTLVAVKDGALHRSTDGGATWTKGDAFPTARYNRIQTITTMKGAGYLLTPQGLKMSKDKGSTWTLYGSPVNISGTQEYWPNGPFFGADEKHCVLIGWDGVFQTEDAGAHWNKVAPFPAEWPVPPDKAAGGAIFAWDPIHNIVYGCCGKMPALYCQLPPPAKH